MRTVLVAVTLVLAVAVISPALGQDCDPSHCNQSHNHGDAAWTGGNLQNCPWKGQIDWSFTDAAQGFNEGAACAAGIAGVKVPDPGGQVLGNVWKRREMMNAAKDLAKNKASDAAARVAICSQYHNCHACRCLEYHKGELTNYLASK